MKRLLLLLGVCFTALFSQNLFGQACQSSNASSYSSWTTNSNDNSFGAWTITTTSGNSGQNGAFIGNSGSNGSGSVASPNTPNINTSDKAWALYANSGQTAAGWRNLPFTMATGHKLSVSMDNGWVDNGGTVGFAIQNASGNNLMEFYYIGGQSGYTINDASNTLTSIAFSDRGFDFTLTMTSATTYTLTVFRKENSSTSTFTGRTFMNPAGGQVPARIRVFNFNSGGGAQRDAFFNNISLCRPTISTTGTLSAVSTTYGTASSNTSFSLSGAEMFAGITVSAPSGFQVSTNPSSGFASSIVVGAAGTISSTTVYVRLAANAPVVGAYNAQNVVLSSTGANSVNVVTAASGNSVSPAGLTITGISVNNKVYNGNATATLSGTPAYVGLQNSESFSVTGTPVASFNNANAGNIKPVTISGYTAPSTNYTVTQPTGLTANIAPLGITVTPDAGQSKVFGASDPAFTYTNSPALIGPDVFSGALGRAGGEAVGFYSYTLGTLSAGGNYSLSLGGSNTFAILGLGQSTADFRSKAPGNFSAASTWEYDQGGGSWVNATQAPGSNNNVSISHAVSLNQNFTVGAGNSFTLASGGSFTINPDQTITVAGSADFGGQPVTFASDATGYGSLGQVTGTLTGASNVTVERYLPNNGFRSWRLLSVPTSGSQTIKQAWQENNAPLANGTPGYGTLITGGGNNTGASQALGFDFSGPNTSMQFWNGTGWSNISGTLGALSARQAYFLYVRGDRSKAVTGLISDAGATTLRSNGSLYTGNQSFNVPAGQFQVIPNLYPSAINFTGLTRSGIASNYTIWDSKTQYVYGNGANSVSLGRYVTFTEATGWEPSVSSVSYPLAGAPYTTIESGQAFFVQDNPAIAGGGTVTLVESAKTSASANGNLGLRPVKRAMLRTDLLWNSEVIDGNVAVFDAQFSNAYDGQDAQKMGNPGANFGIESNSKLLNVEGREPARSGDVLQFRMWNLAQGNYQLKFAAGSIAEPGVEALLEDSYSRQVTPLQLNGSTVISFTVTSDAASQAANRFRVVFRKGISAVETSPAITVAPNPVTGGALNLRFSNQPEGRYMVRVMSLNGQVLLNKVVMHTGGSSNQLMNLGSRFAAGNYRMEVISPDKTRTVQSLIIR